MKITKSFLFALILFSCVGPQPSQFVELANAPVENAPLLLLKSVRIPHSNPIVRFAHHSWFDWRDMAGQWWRLEVNTDLKDYDIDASFAAENVRWKHDVQVLAIWHGDVVLSSVEKMRALVNEWPHYEAWPGPNSNTFMAEFLEQIPELASEMHHNAVGKDWVKDSWIHFGASTSGTGLELDLPYVGAGIGLKEGFEMRLIGLTCGVSIWPPAIKLPMLPRIGLPIGFALKPLVSSNQDDGR